MPPVRIKERARAKKGTMKRLLKMLFKQFPGQLLLSLFCLIFNVVGNLCSSIFASLATSALTAAGTVDKSINPFIDVYPVTSAFGFVVNTNLTYLLIILGSVYAIGILASWTWNRTMAIVTQKFMNNFREAMFNHMQDLPIA